MNLLIKSYFYREICRRYVLLKLISRGRRPVCERVFFYKEKKGKFHETHNDLFAIIFLYGQSTIILIELI